MMGIGFPELMIILVIIMIIFGAGKLPQIGSAFGQSIKNFKKSMKEAEEADPEGEAQPEIEGGEANAAVPETTSETTTEEAPATESQSAEKTS